MLQLIEHPLIRHNLRILRDRRTGKEQFQAALERISSLMLFQLSSDLMLQKCQTETPLESCSTEKLDEDIVLIPILRAGMGMLAGISGLIPEARVGHIGMARDHESLEPEQYYLKLPVKLESSLVLLMDPMLATGGSASAALSLLKRAGAKRLKLLSIVGAPEGVSRIERDHPETGIYLAALDRELNEKGYILPGLGDAGDRIYGTD